MPEVTVQGVPTWVPVSRLLGSEDWQLVGPLTWNAELERNGAADLLARLRGVGLDGVPLRVSVRPPLRRPVVRAARTEDARRRRNTTPGFVRSGTRLDPEGRMSLTPEALALALGRQAAHDGVTHVIDATCGAGGNAIGFARAKLRVTALEPQPNRLADARHNAKIYQVTHRIRFISGRAEDHLPSLQGDLVFIDPPWGKDWNRGGTRLSDLPVLESILSAIRPETPVWIKVPPSFATWDLPHTVPEPWFGEAPGDRQRIKFVLLRTLP